MDSIPMGMVEPISMVDPIPMVDPILMVEIITISVIPLGYRAIAFGAGP